MTVKKYLPGAEILLRCDMKKTPSSRHGVRADNKTQTSISLRLDLLQAAQASAAREGRTFSNWLEQVLKDRFPGAATAKPAKPAKKAPAKKK
jgi:hypothetical protein